MANLVYRRRFTVEWGHCDPAGIVFNTHFFEFFDWSVWLLFETALGVPPNEMGTAFGIVGIPLVDAKARFLKPAKFNDVADIASEVSEFRRSSFDVAHLDRRRAGRRRQRDAGMGRARPGRSGQVEGHANPSRGHRAVSGRSLEALSCSKFPIAGLAERVPLGACPGAEDVSIDEHKSLVGL